MIEQFKYENTYGDDVILEINFNLLKVIVKTTTYNFKGEVVSRNKIVGWWIAKNKIRLFNILRNSIGDMSEETNRRYKEFIDKLERKVKEETC